MNVEEAPSLDFGPLGKGLCLCDLCDVHIATVSPCPAVANLGHSDTSFLLLQG